MTAHSKPINTRGRPEMYVHVQERIIADDVSGAQEADTQAEVSHVPLPGSNSCPQAVWHRSAALCLLPPWPSFGLGWLWWTLATCRASICS